MKILKKEIRRCENSEGKEEIVLHIEYSHYRKKWEVQIRDYGHLVDDEDAYNHIVKQLRQKVSNHYKNYQAMLAHNKERIK